MSEQKKSLVSLAMNVPGGTEGPWRWEAFDVGNRNERITVIDDGQRICDIYGFSNHPQHIGFANIISAAPELYAALAALLPELRRAYEDGDCRLTSAEIDAIEATLAKAQGEQP